MSALEELVAVVARLRGPGGCDWDRAQTPATLRPYLLEEAHEVLAAVDAADPQALCKELGDLLFQIVLLARMAEERGQFTLQDVCAAIAQKMVQRHPHVFDPDHAEDNPATLAAWEARKAREQPERSLLDGVPPSLPALLRAHRVGEKVATVGFDWPDALGAREKVHEELAELDEALHVGAPAAVEAEYGDVLLAMASYGRLLGLAPEDALRGASARFERRFRALEQAARAAGVRLHERPDPAVLEDLWQQVKAAERARDNLTQHLKDIV